MRQGNPLRGMSQPGIFAAGCGDGVAAGACLRPERPRNPSAWRPVRRDLSGSGHGPVPWGL